MKRVNPKSLCGKIDIEKTLADLCSAKTRKRIQPSLVPEGMLGCADTDAFLKILDGMFSGYNINIYEFSPTLIYVIGKDVRDYGKDGVKKMSTLAFYLDYYCQELDPTGFVMSDPNKPEGSTMIGKHRFEFSISGTDNLAQPTYGTMIGRICVDLREIILASAAESRLAGVEINSLQNGFPEFVEKRGMEIIMGELVTEFEKAFYALSLTLNMAKPENMY